MPSKEYLMNKHFTANEVLSEAVTLYGVRKELCSVRLDGSGRKHISACLASNENDAFDGSGVSTKEAMADCISKRFPA